MITKEFITKEKLTEILNLSIGKIDNMMKQKQIPFYKVGKSVRFDVDEVLERLKKDYKK